MPDASQMTGQQKRYASAAQVAVELARLSSADFARLEKIARVRSSGLTQLSWQDLLQEAVARVLEGSRRWPQDVVLVAFLAQVMRSLASDIRRRPMESSLDEPGSAIEQIEPDLAHQALENAEALTRIERQFSDDPIVLLLIDGLAEGETAVETKARHKLSPQSYDAARKRFWRGVAKIHGGPL